MPVASIADFRAQARRRLPHFLFEYIDGGSYNEVTLRANRQDLRELALRQRVLKNVENVSTATNLFGDSYSMPVALAPVGLAGINRRRGEVLAARAAQAHNIPFTLSTVSLCSIEEVAAAVEQPSWFQLYMLKDRGFITDLLQRVEHAGCTTLIMTVDLPVIGSRYRDHRSGMTASANISNQLYRLQQLLMRPRWLWDVGLLGGPHTLGNLNSMLSQKASLADYQRYISDNFDASTSWDAVEFIRSHWSGKIVLKGILDSQDAQQASTSGVDGIVVSNHGGRQLDGALSTARALPAIVDRIAGDLTVLADGGIESGLDVLRMLALGADGVMLGRAWCYALAADGERGVAHMLSLLKDEMRVAMALTGHTSIASIDRQTLCRR
ncbi:MAG: L-lactate dehydrogenase [Cellvibrionales bacterium]|nr:L-lactate dehydrogenase [Porticoccaceae bacterium]|tara:strand:- start:3788 stop:4933 length:1146 start_codon:yes stop_codon:yes gene_type:complete